MLPRFPLGLTGWASSVLLSLLAAPAAAQLPETSPKTIDYELECQLLDEGKVIDGVMRVTWRNQTEAPTSELLWHVYNNAFSGRDSVWLKEAHQYQYSGGRLPREYSNTDIEGLALLDLAGDSLRGEDGLPLSLRWEWVPQAKAPMDRTVFRVELPKPVAPGESVTVLLEFQARLAPAYRRNGWGSEGYVHAAQWYPKLGVFEKLEGSWQWNCLPYRMLVEFYSDYADFDLKLVVPKEYRGKVVATGTPQSDEPEVMQDGSLRYHFVADDVHDFAWSADPKARVVRRMWREEDYRDEAEEQKVAAALGRSVEEVRPSREVEMVLLLQPEHGEFEDRYFKATAQALYYMGLWYGEYPYDTISIVDPAHDARWTGGMEYPRLFTGGVHKGAHERVHDPEGVTVHEFGHQYWYGLVGTDEFRHAWMDEGFCVFSTQRVLQKAFQPELATYRVAGHDRLGRAPLGWPAEGGGLRGLATLRRLETPEVAGVPSVSVELFRPDSISRYLAELPGLSYWPRVQDDAVLGLRRAYRTDFYQPIATPSGDLFEWNMRGVNTYSRPAMTLETMARLMGEERWIRLIRAYHERFRFGHPRPQDWFEVVAEFATGARVGASEEREGIVIDWVGFWRQAYRGNEILDFGVHRVANLPHLVDDAGEEARVRVANDQWDVHVELRRFGSFEVPVEFELLWTDGSRSRHVWNGSSETHAVRRLGSEQRVVQVVVDPERKLVLDRNWLNNTYTVDLREDLAAEAGARALLWAESVLHYFGGIG
ncbi:MAG: hypothetical protein CMJ94_06015 [Planctomycetes bacterium]|nr:hypothetical protein [Planctomycetota bacterium]